MVKGRCKATMRAPGAKQAIAQPQGEIKHHSPRPSKQGRVTEVDVDNGVQLYPYDTLAEAKAAFDLIKIQQRGALDNGRFRDRKFESILKRNDRI